MFIDKDLFPLSMQGEFAQPSLFVLEPFVILFASSAFLLASISRPALHGSVVRLGGGIEISQESSEQPLAALLVIWYSALSTWFPATGLFLLGRLRGAIGTVGLYAGFLLAGQWVFFW